MIIFLRVILLFSVIINKSTDAINSECQLQERSDNDNFLVCRNKQQVMPIISEWSFANSEDFVLSGIQYLEVVRKGIKSFKNGIFTKFTNVQRIDLSENALSAIDFNEFKNNLKLTALDVSDNKIFEIKPIKNSTIINIRELIVNKNDLTDISELCKLTKLKRLNLSGNRRLDVSNVMFNCWSELATLFLVDTNLKNLNHDYQVLAGCSQLKYLNLMDNNLEMFCLEQFPKLPKLTHLNIRNNSLINLNVLELKRRFPVLLSVGITGNNWSCDYYDTSLKQQLENSSIVENRALAAVDENACIDNPEFLQVKELICPKTGQSEDNETSKTNLPPFWIIGLLICVIFVTEIVRLGYFKHFINLNFQV